MELKQIKQKILLKGIGDKKKDQDQTDEINQCTLQSL